MKFQLLKKFMENRSYLTSAISLIAEKWARKLLSSGDTPFYKECKSVYSRKKTWYDRQFKCTNEIRGKNTENQEGPNLTRKIQNDPFACNEVNTHSTGGMPNHQSTKRRNTFSIFSSLSIKLAILWIYSATDLHKFDFTKHVLLGRY